MAATYPLQQEEQATLEHSKLLQKYLFTFVSQQFVFFNWLPRKGIPVTLARQYFVFRVKQNQTDQKLREKFYPIPARDTPSLPRLPFHHFRNCFSKRSFDRLLLLAVLPEQVKISVFTTKFINSNRGVSSI